MKILFYDIETTDLKADRGTILCIAYTWYGSDKIKVGSVDPKFPRDDKPLLKEFLKELQKADIVVYWYGDKFDSRFVTARCLYHGLDTTPLVKSVDGWRIARRYLALTSNRLENVSRFLNVPERKTRLDFKVWDDARFGDRKALKYIKDHAIADIRVLAQVYEKLAPLYHQHPRLAYPKVPYSCELCKGLLGHRGTYITRHSRHHRYICTNCGHWQKGEKIHETVSY